MAIDEQDGQGLRLGSAAVAAASPLRALLRQATYIGGIYDLGFQEASIISNDEWVRQANGVPQHCFLLAAVKEMTDDEEAVGMDAADREVILLRVLRETTLPNQSELTALRAEVMDRIITERYQTRPQSGPVADVLTREVMQRAAFRCQVLGTFYEDEAGGLQFGKDIDNVYAAGRYEVSKPWGASLQTIVDHCELPLGEQQGEVDTEASPNADLPDGGRFPIGTLRYSSTQRRELIARDAGIGSTEVTVSVRAKDFVAHKTAVFGMTRAGKSNTMKVIATAVHEYAHRSGVRVGQLIFDPTGEYAYPNPQDGTALFQISNDVRVYRLGATEADIAAGFRPLSLNFFRQEDIEAVWSLISTYLREYDAQYIQNFLATEPQLETDGMERGDKRRTEALRAMLYACLLKANFRPPANWSYRLPMKDELHQQLVQHPGLEHLAAQSRDNYSTATADELLAACEFIAALIRAGNPPNYVDLFSGAPGMDSMARVLVTSGVASGWRILQPLRPFHSPISTIDYAEAIYSDLGRGRIVIVDLSRGNEVVLQTCSERVVNHILRRASTRFREGRAPRPMQIFIEEAHRLLHRDKFNKAAGENDPYVRLAKESAKFRIGMIYATQEVSSVDESILSNTANWIAAYMNNQHEAKRLAAYYDFDRFTDQILSADDRGFIRLRTDSAAYTLPVQVRKFDLDMVNQARATAGLEPARGLEPESVHGEQALDDDDLVDTDAAFGRTG
ncbi:MAG: ATP-binding protein [Gaiellaceae bacterium]